ncbi:MAG: enoyl-CoA hydratase/isomerase family protein [Candidatus Binataceae bacterium]
MAQVSHSIRSLPPSPGFSTIRFAKRNRIAWITLNRPRQLNAYNVAMRDDLFAALSAIHDDPEVRAMVLSGARWCSRARAPHFPPAAT